MNQQHQSPIQPIYRTSPHFVDGSIIKEASLLSSTRSPTTVVFAVDELSNVFRVADDDGGAIERQRSSHRQHEEEEEGIFTIRRSRPLITPSFTTDGELSTFSEDTDEATIEGLGLLASSDDESREPYPAMLHRQQQQRSSAPLQSIFRPVMSGMKRRSCDVNSDDEEEDDHYNYLNNSDRYTPTKKRSCGAPSLCHANPIGSNDGYDDDVPPPTSQSYSFASPFKRICSRGDTTIEYTTAATTPSRSSSSPYTALFAEGVHTTTSTLTSSRLNTTTNNITLRLLRRGEGEEGVSSLADDTANNSSFDTTTPIQHYLAHPLSFETSSIFALVHDDDEGDCVTK